MNFIVSMATVIKGFMTLEFDSQEIYPNFQVLQRQTALNSSIFLSNFPVFQYNASFICNISLEEV